MNLSEKENISNKTSITINRSAVVEHLVKNQSCAEICNLKRFKTIKNYYKVFDVVKMEATCILNKRCVQCI